LRVVGVSSSVHLNKEDPYAPVNRRISIVVLNRRAQADIENSNTATSALKQASARPAGGKQAAVDATAAKPGSRI